MICGGYVVNLSYLEAVVWFYVLIILGKIELKMIFICSKYMNTNKMDIVEGYKGIMDLDLTNVREDLKKELVKQHQKDIDEYKGEQNKLESRLRYENTIERVQQIHHKDKLAQKKRKEEDDAQQLERMKIYNDRRQ